MKELLALKKEEKEKRGESFDGKINLWDTRYYGRIREERVYNVDHQKLKSYFPLQVVTKGLLEIYETLLGLKFTQIPNPHVWHPDVSLYRVNDSQTNELVGHFYLDLHPREGKYGHAACFGLQPGCVLGDGSRQYPAAAMVANFTKPKPGEEESAVLEHDEVETFFHEFGHVMHQLCSRADYAFFSGTAVERDFVEAPSQMLENWVWERESLAKMSQHVKDKTPIPEDLLQSLIKSRVANAGYLNRRQLFFALFDYYLHTAPKTNTAELGAKLSRELLLVDQSPGTNMAGSFGHVAQSYDAQYYGYLWSEVFSDDMFLLFKKEGVLNQTVGRKYRENILEKGGSRDAADMLRDFLGREPSNEAFLRNKGLAL